MMGSTSGGSASTLATSDVYSPMSLAVDEESQTLFWVESYSPTELYIESIQYNSPDQNREVLLHLPALKIPTEFVDMTLHDVSNSIIYHGQPGMKRSG